MHAQALESFPTLCDSMNCSPPGSSIHGILQARILGWVAMLPRSGIFPTQESNLVSCIAGGFFTAKPLGKPRQISVIVTSKLVTHVEV